jgi:two-component system sensor histidine kinase/response regulator
MESGNTNVRPPTRGPGQPGIPAPALDMVGGPPCRCGTNQLLSFLAAHTDDAMILTDAQGQVEWVNRGFTRTTGYALGDLLGKRPEPFLIGPNPDPATKNRIQECLARGESFRSEVVNRRKDGRRFWAEVEIQPVRNGDGKIAHFLALERDITELRRAVQRRTIQYDVSRSLAEDDDFQSGVARALEIVINSLDWAYGALWRVEPGRQNLRFEQSWHIPNPRAKAFAIDAQHRRFGWGDDLPGRVWATHQPVWIEDLGLEPHLPRATTATHANLAFAIAFPVLHRDRLWGVLEFFGDTSEPPDADLLRLLESIACLVSQFEDRLAARRDLELQKTLFESLFSQAPVAIAVLDDYERVRTVNTEFTRLFGYPADEITGLNLNELLVPPGFVKAAAAASRDLAAGRRVSYEAARRSKDGADRVVQVIGQPVVLTATQAGVYALFLDLTARKHAELALRESGRRLRETTALQQAILEGANYAIVSTDPNGIIRTFNSAAEKMLGYDAPTVIGTESVTLVHVPEELTARAAELSIELQTKVSPDFEAIVAKARRGRPDEREWTFIRKDGSRFPVLLATSALIDENGQISGFLSIGIDITERRRVAEELLRAKEAAEAANRAKSDFLATVSHEIRTPMNGILGMSALLLDTHLDPAHREMVGAVHASAEALLSLINEILDLSKIEARRLDLVLEEIELDTVLDGVVDLLVHEAHQRGLQLAVVLDPQTPKTFRTDAARLRQILINLVGNAIKFTLEGEIVLAVEPVDKMLRFSVSDTGIGLSPEQQERLFQPFTQVDSSTTRRFGGSGLGLAISKRIVELLGGHIGVESGPGAGSTFWFTLPNPITPRLPQRSPLRVLVADDHPHACHAVRSGLESLGVHPDFATRESELAELIRSGSSTGPYDLVIADRVLLGRATVEALKRIRAESGGRPHVALTGVAAEASEINNAELGTDTFVAKPVKRSALAHLIALLADSATPQLSSSATPNLTAAPGPLQSLRVLVAEDNDVNGRLALMMLAKLGCRGEVVGNGRRAVELVRDQRYDAVLMDCHMPEMDGYAAAAAIRELEVGHPDRPRTHIIAMTAAAMTGERERCLAAGMDDYLTKPVRTAALRDALQRLPVQSHPNPTAKPDSFIKDTLDVLASELSSEAVAELLESFLADTPQRLTEMVSLAGTPDQISLRRAAHSLKGTAALVGASELEQGALLLEEAAAVQRIEGQMAGVEGIRLAFEKVRPHLVKLLAGYSHPDTTPTPTPSALPV